MKRAVLYLRVFDRCTTARFSDSRTSSSVSLKTSSTKAFQRVILSSMQRPFGLLANEFNQLTRRHVLQVSKLPRRPALASLHPLAAQHEEPPPRGTEAPSCEAAPAGPSNFQAFIFHHLPEPSWCWRREYKQDRC
jgi:hypothetical protein